MTACSSVSRDLAAVGHGKQREIGRIGILLPAQLER